MFYFYTTDVDPALTSAMEENLRRCCAKRHTSLDLQSSSSYLDSDKMFLGLESKTDFKITRIRTPFERVLPKLIVSFPQENSFTRYRVRYGVFSFLFLTLMGISLVSFVYEAIVRNNFGGTDLNILLLVVLFIGLTFLELYLIKLRLSKAAAMKAGEE